MLATWKTWLELTLTVIELGEAAFAGFAEPVVKVHAGFLHGAANHIIADIPGAGKEIAQIAGIHGPDGGYGITLDAGDLDEAADGIAGQSQMMLHCHLGGIFHLIQVLLV